MQKQSIKEGDGLATVPKNAPKIRESIQSGKGKNKNLQAIKQMLNLVFTKNIKIVYVCSPYSDTQQTKQELNEAEAIVFARIVLENGGIPVVPHIYFTRFTDENNSIERQTGMMLSKLLMSFCSHIFVFGKKITKGMAEEIEIWKKNFDLSKIVFIKNIEQLPLESNLLDLHNLLEGMSNEIYNQ